jgi:putative peptidoglycan lipid II flippase
VTDFEQAPVASAEINQPQSSLRSISLITALTVLQLILQFGLQLVLAKYFGAAGEMDAYVAALAWPVVIATILSSSLGYVLVPAVAKQLASGGPRDAAMVASQIGLALLAVAAIFTIGTAFAARPLTAILCPGFSPTARELTARLIGALSLLILANSLTAYLNALFHSYGHFARPAIAGVVGMFVTLFYVVALHGRQGIDAVAWGVVIGATTTTFILLPLFVRQIREAAVWKQPHVHVGTRQAGALLLPLVLGAIYWRLDPLLDRYLGSYLQAGSIAHISYAWRLISGLMLIGTSGLSIVAFPAIASHTAAGRRAGLNIEVAHAIRFFLFLIVPICIGLCLFSVPVVRLLFERGRFTAADTQAVAMMVVLYASVIFGAGMGDLLSRTLYARDDTLTPVIVQSIAFTIAAGLKFVLVARAGAAGLVAITSGFYLLNAAILSAILLRQLGPDMLAGSGGTLARSVVSSAIACLAAGAMMLVPVSWAVLPAAAGGALVYACSMLMLRDEFAVKLYQRFVDLPATVPQEEQT